MRKDGWQDVKAFYVSLPPDEREVLSRADAILDAAEGHDCELTFRKGDGLLLAHGAVDEGTFSSWLKVKWRHHRTYAYSFMRVVEQLAPYRKRLIAARVERSTLMTLASQPQRAEDLLARFETGTRLSLRQAKALIAGDGETPSADRRVQGGLKGLRKLHAAKGRHLPGLAARLEGLVKVIDEALAAPRLLKGALAEAVAVEARTARAELFNLCAFVHPPDVTAPKGRPEEFPPSTPWRAVTDVLYALGGVETWPAKDALEGWLRGTVLPTLRWAALDQGEVAAAEPDEVPAGPATRREAQQDSGCSPEDAATYLIPPGEACEGPYYDVKPTVGSDWVTAELSGGVWLDRKGRPVETVQSEMVVRIRPEDAVQAEEMLHKRRLSALSEGGSETAEETCRRFAATLASFLVCRQLIYVDEEGPAAAARNSVAEALWQRCMLKPVESHSTHESGTAATASQKRHAEVGG